MFSKFRYVILSRTTAAPDGELSLAGWLPRASHADVLGAQQPLKWGPEAHGN